MSPQHNQYRIIRDLTPTERFRIGSHLLNGVDLGILAQEFRLSHGAIKHLADSYYQLHLDPGPIDRCPECGYRVILPCRICHYRNRNARRRATRNLSA